jgi:hypothetical protein
MSMESALKRYPWYYSFDNAQRRCRDKSYKSYHRYGGRGIKFNMTHDDFQFLWDRDNASEMKQPSIDRIDNDKDYVVSNCRFIEHLENTRNGSIARGTKVSQIKDGIIIASFKTVIDAERSMKRDNPRPSAISKAINGRRTAYGFKWIKSPIERQASVE